LFTPDLIAGSLSMTLNILAAALFPYAIDLKVGVNWLRFIAGKNMQKNMVTTDPAL
jgi:hypothetical protein